MTQTLYMVVEHFKNDDAVPVYRRFRERGRMAPEGLNYISSWVDHDLARCYQIMETTDHAFLNQWMANWEDLIEFEVHPVMISKEASEREKGQGLRWLHTYASFICIAACVCTGGEFQWLWEGKNSALVLNSKS